jgi:hypothetical protein
MDYLHLIHIGKCCLSPGIFPAHEGIKTSDHQHPLHLLPGQHEDYTLFISSLLDGLMELEDTKFRRKLEH